jgi:hypothetical protein
MNYVADRLGEKLRWNDDYADDPEAWRAQWSSAFLLRHRHVITKSEELATELAALARRLRTRIRTILRMEDGYGEIRKLQRAFQTGLIHDLDDDAFADMFAQTVIYGLFSVSVRRTFAGEGTALTRDDLPNLIFTSPFLKEMLGVFLGIQSRKGAIDFDELGVSDVTDLLTSPDTHMEVVLADFNNKSAGFQPAASGIPAGRSVPNREAHFKSAAAPARDEVSGKDAENSGQDARAPLPIVEKISWSRDTVWVDKAQTTGFQGVREDVWNFHIGGYQVCEKWLKDRKGRILTKDDLAHYQKIVVALSETIRLMAEIDTVIEHHGGWPGAFAASASATPAPPFA